MSFDQPMQEIYWNAENSANGLYDENAGNSVFYQDLKQENIDMLNQASNGFGYAEPQFQPNEFQQQSHQQHNQSQLQGSADTNVNFAQLPQFGTSEYLNQSISSHSSPSMNGFENGPIKYSAISPESIDDKSQNQQQQQQQQQQQSGSKKATQSKRHLLDEQDAILLAREDSELNEEELLAKKKAQNRAAQRAFRERKESRFKDLEAKLNKSEVEKQKLLDQLTYFRTQNEYQKQQEQKRMNTAAITPDGPDCDRVIHAQFTFPQNQELFINEMTDGHPLSETSDIAKVYDAPDYPNTKLLAVGAVWDYLHMRAEELERDDQYFDVVEIMAKLKGNEKCHGYGPAYPLDVVNRAIEESLRQ
ncbi:putative fluconazole resistance protein 3 [[Candida] railenensis]|uniref:Fluconazole resistance protein 3 n=1 Tax=[Candida] railenensis TaxID=45579 RepID=A0A9P0VWS9_9ASCO|nr:putative fluconazole resistance protein 3 [[Candida] railenensis]